MKYDIIGDVHGQHLKLEALLTQLGYERISGVFKHPKRQALFVGDLIDRGPGQLATLNLVRSMVEEGSAQVIMGNHEFNAICFATEDINNKGSYLRPRNEKNFGQHQAFLDEVGMDTALHRHWIDWFMTLPLWLETDNLRVVHACWHPEHMEQLSKHLTPQNTLTPELVVLASRKGSPEYLAIEAVCKGLEVALPPPVTFTDKQGIVRNRTRVRWWDEQATTYRQAALMGKNECLQLPDTTIPNDARVLYDNKKPVFFGHYWFTGNPNVLSHTTCCVDYSAARDSEPLVCYRFDGEQHLSQDKLVWVNGVEASCKTKQKPQVFN